MPRGRPIDLAPRLGEYLRSTTSGKGARLPSVHKLAKEWGVNRFALNRAVTRLIGEGRLERRGTKLYLGSPPGADTRSEEPPYRILIVAPEALLSQEFRHLLERAHWAPVSHLWNDISQSWPLLAKKIDTPCEGALLVLDDTFTVPANAAELINRLIDRRIPVVCNMLIGRGSAVVNDANLRYIEAAKHLAGLGHRRVLIPVTGKFPNDANAIFRQATESFSGAGITSFLEVLPPEPPLSRVRAMLGKHLAGKNPVTAVFCPTSILAPVICEAAKKLRIQIPGQLSLLCGDYLPLLEDCSPPVTCWAQNALKSTGPLLALDLLTSQVEYVRKTGRMPPREIIEQKPALIERASVGPATAVAGRRSSGKKVETHGVVWSPDPEVRKAQLAAFNLRPYPGTQRVTKDGWVTVNLRRVYNRQFERENGWVNNLPLLHLPRGRQVVHGVPFQLAGGIFSKEPDCVVLRSERAHTGMGKKLPEAVSVAIGCRVQKIYFLHGCGFVGAPEEFACYEFHFTDGEVVRQPLIPAAEFTGKTGKVRANIEDCWPYKQRKYASSRTWRRFVLTDNDDPFAYERHLFTLEWSNPNPGKELAALVMRSKPESTATLGVLAVTALVGEKSNPPKE